jgi:hypothetical protein
MEARSMSTIKVNTIQNTSGVEQYTAKAWVNFNGESTVAIRADGNVSSITDIGTGRYTINYSSSMVDSNYSITGSAHGNTIYPEIGYAIQYTSGTPVLSGSLFIYTGYSNAGSAAVVDLPIISITINR